MDNQNSVMASCEWQYIDLDDPNPDRELITCGRSAVGTVTLDDGYGEEAIAVCKEHHRPIGAEYNFGFKVVARS